MKSFNILTGTACGLLIAATTAFGGQPGSSAEATARGEYVASAPETQEDIGDIRPADDGADLSRLRTSIQGTSQFVSNAKLLDEHSSGDVLWIPAAEIGYNVPLGKQFSLDFLGRAESIFYSDHVERSFFGFSGVVSADYRYKEEWPRAYVGLEPYWYQSTDTGDKLASAIGFSVGADQGIPVNRGLTLLFWGAKFTTFEASPSTDDRYQYRLIAGITHQFRPALYGQLYYSWQDSDYHENSRHDSRHALGATLVYQFTRTLFGSVGGAFVDNDSTHVDADYQNATGSLGLTWQF